MAGHFLYCNGTEVASGTSAKTVLQVLAATNVPVYIHEFGVGFAGAVSTDVPVTVQLLRQTGAGTSTEATATLAYPMTATQPTTQLDILHVFSSEPTSDDAILFKFKVHPQSGLIYRPPVPIYVPSAGRVGIKVTAAATVNLHPFMVCEE